MTVGKFALDVTRFIEKSKKNPERVMRAVAIKLFSAVIYGSPVDTGRFRMNWQVAGGLPATGIVPGNDLSGNSAVAEMTNFVTRSSYWEEFTLTNNLPYAQVIEYGMYPGDGPNTVGGYSKQAPQGVVRVNVMRFNQLLDEEAARYK